MKKSADSIILEVVEIAKDSGYDIDVKRYTSAVKWLFDEKNKEIVLKCYMNEGMLDYPNYFDMPKSISSKLSGDEVDLLQNMIQNQFEQYYHQDITNLKNKTVKRKM